MIKKSIIIFFALAIILIVVIFFESGLHKFRSDVIENNEKINLNSPENSNQIKTIFISGQVIKYENGIIALKIISTDNQGYKEQEIIRIETDKNTMAYQMIPKSTEQYNKELEEFNKKLQEEIKNPITPSSELMPPNMSVKEAATLDKIMENQQITAIIEENSLKAKEIYIQ